MSANRKIVNKKLQSRKVNTNANTVIKENTIIPINNESINLLNINNNLLNCASEIMIVKQDFDNMLYKIKILNIVHEFTGKTTIFELFKNYQEIYKFRSQGTVMLPDIYITFRCYNFVNGVVIKNIIFGKDIGFKTCIKDFASQVNDNEFIINYSNNNDKTNCLYYLKHLYYLYNLNYSELVPYYNINSVCPINLNKIGKHNSNYFENNSPENIIIIVYNNGHRRAYNKYCYINNVKKNGYDPINIDYKFNELDKQNLINIIEKEYKNTYTIFVL